VYPLGQAEKYLYRDRIATVAEHLGYTNKDRLLIINADDFGLSPEVNRAVIDLFERPSITSTTVIIPAESYGEAVALAQSNSGFPCGVHLCLTANQDSDCSVPVSAPRDIPTLLDPSGRFHPDRETFFKYASPQEAYLEAGAQVAKAIADGIDVTHIDSHEGTLQLRPEFAETYLRLASDFSLPVRSGSRRLLQEVGLSGRWIDDIRGRGIHVPDNLIYVPIDAFRSYKEKEFYTLNLIDNLLPGITEIYFHPAVPNGNGAGVSDDERLSFREVRNWDYQLLLSASLPGLIARRGITLIDFKPLRQLTRSR
jgi:chitin disaccharide deacetylase